MPKQLHYSKFKNKIVDYNGVKFHSRFELDCFMLIRQFFGANEVIRQYPIILKPETPRFNSISYVVDFVLMRNDKPFKFLEAKGFLYTKSLDKIKYFEYIYPEDYNNFCLIFPDNSTEIKKRSRLWRNTAIKFSELPSKLKEWNDEKH